MLKMVLLYQYMSLINISNITFQYQCCDTFCTFPGEKCDRSRDPFCVCQACMCLNDSTLEEDQAECTAHCNIERFKTIVKDQRNDEKDEDPKDCEWKIPCIVSFCGNVIGIVMGLMFFFCFRNRIFRKTQVPMNNQKSQETDSLVGRKDSGITDDSGDETETTLKHFNPRRILINEADSHKTSKFLVSGRHDEIGMPSVDKDNTEETRERQHVAPASDNHDNIPEHHNALTPRPTTIVDITCRQSEVQCILDDP